MGEGLSFSAPWVLLLAPLAWLVWRYASPRAAAEGALELPEGLAAAARASGGGDRSGAWVWGLKILLWLGLAAALAGPQRLERVADVSASGRDIILALDLSGSMLIEDFDLDGARVSRLDAVKRVAAQFVSQRAGDRVGLVLFADRAFVAAPLSHDLVALREAVEEAQIGFAGRSTALSEGLGLALNALWPPMPLGTLVANLAGGYHIGVALAVFAHQPGWSPEWRLLVITGFLGGLTTFSTFSAEVTTLLQQGRLLWAGLAISAHVVGSLLMTLAGMATVATWRST